jgi:4-aminobutyrate aminotransferase-like enzyme
MLQVKEEYMERVREWIESIGGDLIVNDVQRHRLFLVL